MIPIPNQQTDAVILDASALCVVANNAALVGAATMRHTMHTTLSDSQLKMVQDTYNALVPTHRDEFLRHFDRMLGHDANPTNTRVRVLIEAALYRMRLQ